MGLKELLKLKSSILILLCSHALADGYLYDELNQYFVICRLTDEKNVKPFFGEDTVKCFYTCQDKEVLVINTHSDYHVKNKRSVRGVIDVTGEKNKIFGGKKYYGKT